MSQRRTAFIITTCIAFALALRVNYAWHGNLAYDEYQHMHAAYLVAQGQTPFVDFFEHHTPLFYFVGAMLVPQQSPNFDTMIHARYLSLAFHLLTIVLAWLWVRSIAGGGEAWLAAALLSANFCFFIWGTRTYVDTYAAPLLVLSAWMLCGSGVRYLLAGACFTLAVLFTQKAVFAAPAIAAVVLGRLFAARRDATSIRVWVVDLISLVGGAGVPLLLLPALLGQAGLAGFVRDAVVLNLHWKARHFPSREIAILLASDGFVWAVASIGLATTIWEILRRRLHLQAHDVPALFFAAFSLGIVALPVVFEEYFILVIPFAGVVAAMTLISWWRSYFAADRVLSAAPMRQLAIIGLFVGASACDLVALRVATDNPLSWTAIGAILLLCAGCGVVVFSSQHGATGVARGGALAALCLVAPVVQQIDWVPRHRNDDERARVDYILSTTKPTDPVFDGRSGFGVFRPHAYRYWFLHDEMQLMLSVEEKSTDIIRALDQRHAPIALVDEFTTMLPQPVRDYLATHYVDTRFPDIKRRSD